MGFFDLFVTVTKYPYMKQEVEFQRKLKVKQEITIDYAFQWWKWVKQFCCKCGGNPYLLAKNNYEYIYISEFVSFCDYLVKYKNVRIV